MWVLSRRITGHGVAGIGMMRAVSVAHTCGAGGRRADMARTRNRGRGGQG